MSLEPQQGLQKIDVLNKSKEKSILFRTKARKYRGKDLGLTLKKNTRLSHLYLKLIRYSIGISIKVHSGTKNIF